MPEALGRNTPTLYKPMHVWCRAPLPHTGRAQAVHAFRCAPSAHHFMSFTAHPSVCCAIHASSTCPLLRAPAWHAVQPPQGPGHADRRARQRSRYPQVRLAGWLGCRLAGGQACGRAGGQPVSHNGSWPVVPVRGRGWSTVRVSKVDWAEPNAGPLAWPCGAVPASVRLPTTHLEHCPQPPWPLE